jgi:hypothetical protein
MELCSCGDLVVSDVFDKGAPSRLVELNDSHPGVNATKLTVRKQLRSSQSDAVTFALALLGLRPFAVRD